MIRFLLYFCSLGVGSLGIGNGVNEAFGVYCVFPPFLIQGISKRNHRTGTNNARTSRIRCFQGWGGEGVFSYTRGDESRKYHFPKALHNLKETFDVQTFPILSSI